MQLCLQVSTSPFLFSQMHNPEGFNASVHAALAKHCATIPAVSPASVREFVEDFCRNNCSVPVDCESFWATTEASTLIINIYLRGETNPVAH